MQRVAQSVAHGWKQAPVFRVEQFGTTQHLLRHPAELEQMRWRWRDDSMMLPAHRAKAPRLACRSRNFMAHSARGLWWPPTDASRPPFHEISLRRPCRNASG